MHIEFFFVVDAVAVVKNRDFFMFLRLTKSVRQRGGLCTSFEEE